jgi:hypothetical protein
MGVKKQAPMRAVRETLARKPDLTCNAVAYVHQVLCFHQ